MESKLRAHLASILFDLRMGKNLPILSFQFKQLSEATAKEVDVNKEIVVDYLVRLFSTDKVIEGDDSVTNVLVKYDISNIIDSLMI